MCYILEFSLEIYMAYIKERREYIFIASDDKWPRGLIKSHFSVLVYMVRTNNIERFPKKNIER